MGSGAGGCCKRLLRHPGTPQGWEAPREHDVPTSSPAWLSHVPPAATFQPVMPAVRLLQMLRPGHPLFSSQDRRADHPRSHPASRNRHGVASGTPWPGLPSAVPGGSRHGEGSRAQGRDGPLQPPERFSLGGISLLQTPPAMEDSLQPCPGQHHARLHGGAGFTVGNATATAPCWHISGGGDGPVPGVCCLSWIRLILGKETKINGKTKCH